MKLLPRWIHYLVKLRWYLMRPMTVGVRVPLIQDGKILLVKHTYQRYWYLPGGGIKRGETLEAALRREVEEEVGAQLGDLRLLGVYGNFSEYKSDHIVVFFCEDFFHGNKTGREIEACAFFDMEDLPASISPGSRRRVEEYLEGNLPRIGRW